VLLNGSSLWPQWSAAKNVPEIAVLGKLCKALSRRSPMPG
jgi:hypothetical protein